MAFRRLHRIGSIFFKQDGGLSSTRRLQYAIKMCAYNCTVMVITGQSLAILLGAISPARQEKETVSRRAKF